MSNASRGPCFPLKVRLGKIAKGVAMMLIRLCRPRPYSATAPLPNFLAKRGITVPRKRADKQFRPRPRSSPRAARSRNARISMRVAEEANIAQRVLGGGAPKLE